LFVLLSASVALAQPSSVTVRGSLDGHAIGTIEGATLHAAGSGAGNASQIGRFNYTLYATVDLTTGSGRGVFILAFLNGDVIFGVFSGQGQPTDAPAVARIVETLTILGGTGRFQGVTGTITFDRIVDQENLPNFDSHSGTLTGTIKFPAK
jgi:hypothetical protein